MAELESGFPHDLGLMQLLMPSNNFQPEIASIIKVIQLGKENLYRERMVALKRAVWFFIWHKAAA